MARKVRCVYCREYGTDETFYKVRKDSFSNRFSYYCTIDEYNIDMENQRKKEEETNKYKELMQYVMEEIYNYEKGMVFPSSLIRRIQKLREFYDYETIMSAFKQSKEAVIWAINNKHFENEYNKTAYIMAIVNNNINDVYLEIKRQEEQKRKVTNLELDNTSLSVMNEVLKRKDKKRESSKGISWLLEDDEL